MPYIDDDFKPKPYGDLAYNNSGRNLLVYYPWRGGVKTTGPSPTPVTPTPTPSGGISPTPTPTPSSTITPTITPTTTPTPTPSPFVASASIQPTGATQYYDVVLTGSSNLSSETYIWSLTNFKDTSGNTITSYTGNPLTEGYFSTTGSSNVVLNVVGQDPYSNTITATTSGFTITPQSPFIVAGAAGSTNYMYSYDGINWSSSTISSGQMNTLAWGEAEGNRIFVGGGAASGVIPVRGYYNITGTSFSDATGIAGNFRMNEINYMSWTERFITGQYENNNQYQSKDGIDWTGYTPNIVFDRYRSTTDPDNEHVVYINDVGDVYVSNDGYTYTATTTLGDIGGYSIIRNSTLGYTMASIGAGGTTYISTDNTTWSATTNTLTSNIWIDGSTYRESDGRTLLVSYGNNTGSITDDGINWSATTLPNIDGQYYLACEHVPPPINLFIAISRTGNIVTSPDGFTWTQQTRPVSMDCFSIHHGYQKQ